MQIDELKRDDLTTDSDTHYATTPRLVSRSQPVSRGPLRAKQAGYARLLLDGNFDTGTGKTRVTNCTRVDLLVRVVRVVPRGER